MSEIPFTDDEINSFCIKPDLSTKVCTFYFIKYILLNSY